MGCDPKIMVLKVGCIMTCNHKSEIIVMKLFKDSWEECWKKISDENWRISTFVVLYWTWNLEGVDKTLWWKRDHKDQLYPTKDLP